MPYLPALLLTLALEVPAAMLWLHWRTEISLSRAALAGAGASLVSHPVLWYVWLGGVAGTPGWTLSGELAVWVVEAVIYRVVLALEVREALALSAVCNLISAVLGGWLYAWIWL